MNLSHLYYFKKLAELQHYTKASKELFITQPSLSGAISCIEDELGIKLFQKQGRNVCLTKYGREFYDFVSNALAELDKGIAVAQEHAGTLHGTVDVGCISTIEGDYLPNTIRSFRNKVGGDIKLNISQLQTNSIIEGVKSGELDVGFCTKVEDEHDLYFVPILSQPLVAVVNSSLDIAKKRSISLNELSGYQLISYQKEQPIGREIESLLKEYGLVADHYYGGEVSLYGVVNIEPYVAVCLKTPLINQFSGLTAIPIAEADKDFHMVHMVFSPERYKTRPVESFIDYVAAFRSYVASEFAS